MYIIDPWLRLNHSKTLSYCYPSLKWEAAAIENTTEQFFPVRSGQYSP